MAAPAPEESGQARNQQSPPAAAQPPEDAAYREQLAWLYGMQGSGIKLGLESMRSLLYRLGWEQGGQRFLHVAGTNGKGSVCAMLESICRAAGMTTGLFTSPHLVTFRERIRINGAMAAREEITGRLGRIRALCEGMEAPPTFFEIATALAFGIFEAARPDIIILETGLGGRLDSTNVVRPLASVITSIGMDHMQLLGGTLAQIAMEKAGIIKQGIPIVTGPLPEDAAVVVAHVAEERNAPLSRVTKPVPDAWSSLRGPHQRMNAAVALRALEVAGIQTTREQRTQGLCATQWPGRFQEIAQGRRRFVLDGAHNAEAARALAAAWRETYGTTRATVILSVAQDKDADAICRELAVVTAEFIVVPMRTPRGGPPERLVEIAARWAPSRACATLEQALAEAPDGETPVLITGSLFLVGEALVALGLAEETLEISAQ